MSEVKVFGILMDYNEETDTTAVKVDLEYNGARTYVKGAAFCAPGDEPRVRVGAFEALVDALRGAPVAVFLEVIRHAVTEGLFSETGWWEQEQIDRDREDRELLRSALEFGAINVYESQVAAPIRQLACGCGGCS